MRSHRDGWVDTPAKLDLPEVEAVNPTVEDIERVEPQELVSMVKALGFMVLTEIEFMAEVSKAAHQLHVDASLAEQNAKFDPSENGDSTVTAVYGKSINHHVRWPFIRSY